jgi:hypothetical protein
MATTFYYTDTLETGLTLTGYTLRKASTSRGAGLVTKTQATTNTDPNPIEVLDDGTNKLGFAVQVNAFTVSANTTTFNHWNRESNAMANYYARGAWNVYTSAGAARFNMRIVNDGSELTTTISAKSLTTLAETSRSINDGDWLVFLPEYFTVSPATGYTVDFSYGATSADVNGDSYITLFDTVTAYSAATTSLPPVGPHFHLIRR